MNVRQTLFKRHPLSALFSAYDLKGEDLSSLAKSIRDHGQQSPITLYEGMILDGWNRYEACRISGIEPVTIDLGPGQDPWEFVKGANMLRRHMSPAERVAVMLLKQRMEGERPKLDTPTEVSKLKVVDVAKDLDVSLGTAHKAAVIAKAQDPELVDALAEKRVSLDEAARLAKLPEEERHAALEAPKEEKPKQPKPTDADPEELARLQEENEELKGTIAELSSNMADLQAELESARRILDSEDLLKQFEKEVVRFKALASTTQSRNNGLMNENADLKGRLKSALRKIEKLEKEIKTLKEAAA